MYFKYTKYHQNMIQFDNTNYCAYSNPQYIFYTHLILNYIANNIVNLCKYYQQHHNTNYIYNNFYDDSNNPIRIVNINLYNDLKFSNFV